MNLLLVYPGKAAKRIFGPQGKRKLGPPPPTVVYWLGCINLCTLTLRTRFSLSLQNLYLKKHRVKIISAENCIQIGFRGFGKYYQEEPSFLVLPTYLLKNINQFKVKLKSIYQNLAETTFDTNNYCMPILVSWLVRVRDVILFLYLSQSLSRHLLCRPAHHTLVIICWICMLQCVTMTMWWLTKWN
jgi:hypothetical protein